MTSWIGTAWALGSAVSWATANASIQIAARRVGSWSALVWAQVIGGLLAAVTAGAIEGIPDRGALAAGSLYVAGAGLAAAVAYGGLFEALRSGQLAIVSPIISAWSVGSVAIVTIQGEPPSPVGALGVAMVVAGNVMLARSSGQSESGPRSQTPRAAVLWAIAGACGFAVMVPLLDHAGRAVGRLTAVPLVWLVELAVLVPLLARLGLLSRPRTPRDLAALSQAAVFEVLGFICLSLGLGSAPVTIVSPVSSLSTMGSVALGVLLLGERISRSALLGAITASAGVVVVNL